QSKTGTSRFVLLLLLLATFSCFSFRLCFGQDKITFTTSINDSDTFLSKSGVFRFGFFTPIPKQTVVWVPNKDTPINDTSGVVSISDNGNLVVIDSGNRILWSTNVTVPVAPNSTWVQLMDTGNLAFQGNRKNGEILTGENLKLTCWRNYQDPSTGNYTTGLASLTFPELTFRELLIWKNNVPIWRSGPWNGQVFIGLPDVDSLLFLDGFNLINDKQGTFSLSLSNDSFMYHFNLDPDGTIYQRDWSTSLRNWRIGTRFPSTYCDAYGICGCVRKGQLRCERQSNGGAKGDMFVRVQKMKVPVNAVQSDEQDCPKQCIDNCSCTAHAFDRGIRCMLWKTHNNRAIIIIAPVLGVAFVAVVCLLLACRKIKKCPDTSSQLMFKRMEALTSGNESASNQVKFKELPLFEFQVLATETDRFSLRNKLRQGGFGPVYKSKLSEGEEIAVKRLSQASEQGLEELMNKVVVISKLQHGNLVKLLGCCIEGEERLLQKILDWKTLFNIMEGICRGLLYLHRDSRLKIIHMNLKRRTDENFTTRDTRRFLGGHPEMIHRKNLLACNLISERKNSHKEENNLKLLAYAWKLWNEGEPASLADPTVFDESFGKDITRFVQIGLLCAQEAANDRPNVSTRPLIARRGSSDQSSLSINDVSLIAVTGR
ncbi:hypothetical protein N665_0763s0002, partial [Sinapis alba]